MHETTKNSLQIIEQLVTNGDYSEFYVANSEFPDRDDGPDEAYEQKVQAEYDQILDEIAAELTAKYGDPLEEPPAWAQLRATGWRAGPGVAYAFLERDDGDTPLIITVGFAALSSNEEAEDPWAYERKEF